MIVLAMAPGAILTDWASKADAAMLMFLGGQETGEQRALAANGWVYDAASHIQESVSIRASMAHARLEIASCS